MKKIPAIKVIRKAQRIETKGCGCLVEYVLCCPKIIPKG